MGSRVLVTSVRLAPAKKADIDRGLLGWVSFDLDDVLRVDGVALRRNIHGRLTLSFPYRKAKSGDKYPLLCPLGAQARAVFERQIFQALGLTEDVT